MELNVKSYLFTVLFVGRHKLLFVLHGNDRVTDRVTKEEVLQYPTGTYGVHIKIDQDQNTLS